MAEGYYTLKAVATNANGNTAIETIRISVGQPDKAPKVSFIKPLNNQIFTAPANLMAEVNAVDETSIYKVELYSNDVLVSTDYTSPYIWGYGYKPLTNMAAGSYTLKAVATDNTGHISDTTINIVVSSAVGISEFSSEQNLITVYPNPADHELNIRFSNTGLEDSEAIIYNSIGERVIFQLISDSQSTISLKHLPAGVYILKIMRNEKMHLERFIKN